MYDKGENTQHKKIAAWFLGPKAENEGEFLSLLTHTLRSHCDWRRDYFPQVWLPILFSLFFSFQRQRISPSFTQALKSHCDWRQEYFPQVCLPQFFSYDSESEFISLLSPSFSYSRHALIGTILSLESFFFFFFFLKNLPI